MTEASVFRVLACGDRNWSDVETVRKALQHVINAAQGRQVVVVEGEARGADSIARDVAKELGLPVEPYIADWTRYGKGAGPNRNQRMLDIGKPVLVIAFHDHLDQSKGTKDMLKRAQKRGLPSLLFTTTKDAPTQIHPSVSNAAGENRAWQKARKSRW